MADILIKNMEMPKEGFVRIMLWHDGGVAIEVSPKNYEQLEDNALELPPHGRLIDAEILEGKVEDAVYRGNQPDDGGWEMGRDTALCLIYDAPTIVEANNGTDN